MTINTQKLRKAAEGANEFIGGDVTEWPLITKNHIRFLASTAIQCADTIDAQAAEIARLKAAQVWQPIETAPKDRRILLMRDGNRICIGRYCSDRGALNVLPEYWTDEGYGVTWARNRPPTHWMPLPATPSALSGGAS